MEITSRGNAALAPDYNMFSDPAFKAGILGEDVRLFLGDIIVVEASGAWRYPVPNKDNWEDCSIVYNIDSKAGTFTYASTQAKPVMKIG